MKDLRIAHVELKHEGRGKVVAGVIIALVVATAGAYAYDAGWWETPPKPVVRANQLPQFSPMPTRATSNSK
jgi:hypothetical protein